MVIFGDEDNMVERFVEIDARVFLEGTAHVASFFSVNRPRYSGFLLESRCEAKCLRRALVQQGCVGQVVHHSAYKLVHRLDHWRSYYVCTKPSKWPSVDATLHTGGLKLGY